MQVAENLVRLAQNPAKAAFRAEDFHQRRVPVARNRILQAVLLRVPPAQTGKVRVELLVEVLPVALSQREADAEVEDAMNARLKAIA